MKVITGDRATGKTTKLIQQMIEDNDGDLSECYIITPYEREHILHACARLGMPLHYFPKVIAWDRVHEERGALRDRAVYVDDVQTILFHHIGEKPTAITVNTP